MSEPDQLGAAAAKRERSPSFPYIDLKTSIQHLEKLYAAAKMNDVRMADAADAWGMTAKSGSLMRYVSALGQFGLVDSSGSGDSRRLKVSTHGRRILEDDRPGVRERLCSEAAMMPKLVRGLFLGEDDMPHWGRDRPNDSIAESALKFDLHFTSEAARRFLSVYDTTIEFVADNEAAKPVIDNSPERALEARETEFAPEVQEVQAETLPTKPNHPPVNVDQTLELNEIDFRKAGKGKIKISAVLDSEGLDLLEQHIKAFRLLVD